MDRFRVVEALRSASGEVLLCDDEVTGGRVVLKRPRAGASSAAREAGALRLLRLPGVVPLVDEGADEQGPWLATRWVEGAWFPGADRTPAALARATERLLTVLSSIHRAGVVHQDLKPSNVLVDGRGDPWVLDFGIAAGDLLGPDRPAAGTPRYMAPEHLGGEPVDARTDLYAVGAMLYEVLTGDVPLPPDARGHLEPPPLRAPGAAAPLAELAHALCARRPDARPQSAAEALERLGLAPPAPHLAWLGDRRPVEALADVVRAGGRADVSAARGMGRSRLLEEAGAALAAEGLRIVPVAPDVDPDAALRRALGEAAGGGSPVLLVDPPCPALAEPIARLGLPALGVGPVVVTLRPLDEGALRGLFAGPDRVQHVPEDAARLLHDRTGGSPTRVAREVAAWLRAGAARLANGRLHVRRSDLEALPVTPADPTTPPGAPDPLAGWVALAAGALPDAELAELAGATRDDLGDLVTAGRAWRTSGGTLSASPAEGLGAWSPDLRRHRVRALLRRLPAPTVDRLRHLLAVGEAEEIAPEALRLGAERRRVGRFAEAAAVLDVAHAACRGHVPAPLEHALLAAWVHAASATDDQRARAAAAARVRAAAPERTGAGWILDLAEASAAIGRRHFAVAEGLLAELTGDFDEEVELDRAAMLVQARVSSRPATADAELAEWREWARTSPDRLGRWHGWCGLAAYRQGRFAEAARHHAAAVPLRTDPWGEAVARVNTAIAALEVPRFDLAATEARAGAELAATLRHPGLELRAWTVLRGIAYRTGAAERPDPELVDAALATDAPPAAAHALLVEGIVAWRAGDPGLAGPLVRAARERYAGFAAAELVCDVLLAERPTAELASRVAALPEARLAHQLHAVLRHRDPAAAGPPPGAAPPSLPRDLALRWELLSPAEVFPPNPPAAAGPEES